MTEMQRPGGRSARVRAAVLAAALEEIAEGGWSALSVERVAARSGVHKTTIYRRWGNVEAVALAALLDRGGTAIPIPDTGGLVGDLVALGRSIAASLEDPLGRSVAAAAIGAPAGSSVGDVAESFWRSRFAEAEAIVARAVARGEAPRGVDGAGVIEALAARVWFRVLVERRSADTRWLRRVAADVARTAAA